MASVNGLAAAFAGDADVESELLEPAIVPLGPSVHQQDERGFGGFELVARFSSSLHPVEQAGLEGQVVARARIRPACSAMF